MASVSTTSRSRNSRTQASDVRHDRRTKLVIRFLKKNLNLTIISGGQTGADRAALDACLRLNVPCGGSCPKGRLAEDGPIDSKYPLTELESKDYRVRTKQNILDSHGTLITSFGPLSGGSLLTYNTSIKAKRPVLHINANIINSDDAINLIQEFIQDHFITILNVAGPRSSRCHKIYNYTFQLIEKFLKLIS